MKDYYKILEVDPQATTEQIKAQYRLLVQAWHPDKFPNNELKSKAEDKLKEINEAYSVLKDPTKRKNYDSALNTYSSSPIPQDQPPYSNPAKSTSTQSAQRAQSIEYCHSCLLPAETKYVEFYENIGMIFMRKHRSVKGNLCKSCIDYYFWTFTGNTMLLGWWGVISFIITPFILLNNLLRFFFTAGMKKPPLQVAPSPSPFWVFSTISGFLLIGFVIFSMFTFPPSQPVGYSYLPTTAPSIPTFALTIPTIQPTRFKTPTPTEPPCIRWDKISLSMAGRKVCVYGIVYNIYSTNETATRINFTSQGNSFFIYDINHVYPDIKAGDCVVAEEVVQLYNKKIPYMSVSGLYKCESWMK